MNGAPCPPSFLWSYGEAQTRRAYRAIAAPQDAGRSIQPSYGCGLERIARTPDGPRTKDGLRTEDGPRT
jgi:hypothetical protein